MNDAKDGQVSGVVYCGQVVKSRIEEKRGDKKRTIDREENEGAQK